jgi:uncharacterized membrane protein
MSRRSDIIEKHLVRRIWSERIANIIALLLIGLVVLFFAEMYFPAGHQPGWVVALETFYLTLGKAIGALFKAISSVAS